MEILTCSGILALTLGLLIFRLAFGFLFRPMNRVRLLEDDLGFGHLNKADRLGRRKRHTVNQLRRARKEGTLPPSFPNGWYAIAESRQVSISNTIEVIYPLFKPELSIVQLVGF